MKANLILIMVLSVVNVFGQSTFFKVPKDWDHQFIITIVNTNSQHGNLSRLTFTYDSCTYKGTMRQRINKDKAFALSQQDRDEILAKMRELKIESIEGKNITAVQQGGWSNVLCLGDHCIDGGSISAVSDTDKEVFLTACRFLQDFARTRK